MAKNQLEAEHQKAFVQYLEISKKRGRVVEYFAPINENNSSFTNRAVAVKTEAKSKAMGKKAGTPDLCVILKSKVLFIEMKRPRKILKSGEKSKENLESKHQKLFRDTINNNCDCAESFVCYGFNEAKELLDKEIGKCKN